ncbi:MAG: glycoside hydrolase family 2 TIM barrel-domain containing protein [Clostridia bacterium]
MREKFLLNEGWKFHLGDIPHKEVIGKYPTYMHSKAKNGLGAAMASFYDGDFENVRIPHDYVLFGEPNEKFNPTQGSFERKTAWYRRHFKLPCQVDGKRFILLFDGAGKKTTVWCNGCPAGQNQSMYNPFYMDITPYLLDEVVNTISVKIENDDIEGWWYEGAGIYRDVWLIITDEISVDVWGTYVNPTYIADKKWSVPVETTVWNCSDIYSDIEIKQSVINAQGEIIAFVTDTAKVGYGENIVKQEMSISNPEIWDLDTPNLYNLKTEIILDGKIIDDYDTSFGFRTIRYDSETGFYLNGRSVKQRGLCYHQDHSNLGVAIPKSIYEYRILEMKEMGANAYRSAHNPTAPGLLDLCDKNGIMVMEENRWFNWSDKTQNELITTLKCGRNHPSVVIWSIGNEEPLQNTVTGGRLVKQLRRLVKAYDTSRPTTIALNGGYFDSNAAAESDVVGVNYNIHLYDKMHETHPNKAIIASETACAAGTRGIHFQEENLLGGSYANDYDIQRRITSASCAGTIKGMEIHPYISGTYLWTGQEYRGETYWPKLMSSSGATDSCGFEKDKSYLLKALWKSSPIVHVFPHWTQPGREGKNVRVVVYNNADSVELVVNGESKGIKCCEKYDAPEWNVEYQPGYIEAIAYDKDGKIIARDKSVTASEPVKLVIESMKNGISNTGEDIAMFKISMLDKDGNHVQNANKLIKATILDEENAEIVSVSGGDPCDGTYTKSHTQKMFNGLLQVLARVKEGATTVGICAQVVDSDIQATFSIDVEQAEPFERLVGGDKEMSIDSFKIWPNSDGFTDTEKTYNFDDMNSNEFILFSNYQPDPNIEYLLFTARAVYPETEKRMSMVFEGIMGEWEMKIFHDEQTWPNPDPVEFITINKHQNFQEKTDYVLSLDGFASYERMKIILVCKNDGNFNMDDVSFKLIPVE